METKNDLAEAFGTICGALTVTCVLTVLFSIIIKWSWNICMPHIFGLPSLNMLQAFSLSVLHGILTFRPNYK